MSHTHLLSEQSTGWLWGKDIDDEATIFRPQRGWSVHVLQEGVLSPVYVSLDYSGPLLLPLSLSVKLPLVDIAESSGGSLNTLAILEHI